MPGPGPSASRLTLEVGFVAVVSLAIYVLGASPTIYVGDSGELVAAVGVLGVPHPTGYPLYVLLGHLWTEIFPFGSVAWRMSLFSAGFAALTVALLYRLCRVLQLHPAACVTAAALLAFSDSFWSQANIQRVYSLNAFFVVAAATLAFQWYQRRTLTPLLLAFLLCGLGAANHTYVAIFGITLSLFVLWSAPRQALQLRTIFGCGAAFFVGLLPYAYLPWSSRRNPPLDWGNPENLEGFLDVVLRRNFWGRAFVEQPTDILLVAFDYLASFPQELTWLGCGLVAIGIVVAKGRGWPLLFLLVAMAANCAAMASHGSRSDIFIWHRYYIPSYLLAALLAGLGADTLLRRLPRALRLAPLLLPAFLLAINWAKFDRSRFEIAQAFSRAVLESLPPGAKLIATDDNILFVLIYLTMVEGDRPRRRPDPSRCRQR